MLATPVRVLICVGMAASAWLLFMAAFGAVWAPPGTFSRDVVVDGALAMIVIVVVAGSASLIGSRPALLVGAALGLILIAMGVFADINEVLMAAYIPLVPGTIALVGTGLMLLVARNRPAGSAPMAGPPDWQG